MLYHELADYLFHNKSIPVVYACSLYLSRLYLGINGIYLLNKPENYLPVIPVACITPPASRAVCVFGLKTAQGPLERAAFVFMAQLFISAAAKKIGEA